MDLMQRSITRLQNNLQAIRKVAGLTTEELGDQIGVTKQTISNLENKKTAMTKTQYLALSMVINTLVETSDNEQLGQVVDVLLRPEADEEEEIKNIVTIARKEKGYDDRQETKKGLNARDNAFTDVRKKTGLAGGIAAVAVLASVLKLVGIEKK